VGGAIELLGIARAVHVAASLSLFGSLLFRATIAPAVLRDVSAVPARRLDDRLDRVVLVSLLAAIVTAAVWVLLQARAMSGAESFVATAVAAKFALLETRYGWVMLSRTALLAAAGLFSLPPTARHRRWSAIVAAGLAGAATLGMAGISHAAALSGREAAILLTVQGLHVAAAGAWLGGLLPLVLTLQLPPRAAAAAAELFSPLGVVCVLALAVTAAFNADAWIGGVAALVGTSYGRWALVKLFLFIGMLGLAARNRFVLTQALADGRGKDVQARLRRSVLIEAALGLAIVLSAGMLASSSPGTHEQAWWPFAFRFSTEALAEPELFREVLLAAVVSLIGAALIAFGIVVRRWAWVSIPAGLVLIAYVADSFELLTVAAVPTSFYNSPTDFSAASIARGGGLFATHCAGCHGARGRGDGLAGTDQAADLTAEHIWDHSDGDLFWWIRHGMDDAMPGFAGTVDERATWDLIDFVHANVAGALIAREKPWPTRALPAPRFEADCPHGAVAAVSGSQGFVLHLVFAAPGDPRGRAARLAAQAAPPRAPSVVTVLVEDAPDETGGASCIVSAPEIATAYAVALGIEPSAIGGSELLIDARGFLRDVWRPGDSPSWDDPAVLSDRIAMIDRTPLAAPPAARHVH
jgi:putative copper export protein/mono/diheme cytochrome c family protein